jgi:hypothetical protein
MPAWKLSASALRRVATVESSAEGKFNRRYATQTILCIVLQSLKKPPELNCRYTAGREEKRLIVFYIVVNAMRQKDVYLSKDNLAESPLYH